MKPLYRVKISSIKIREILGMEKRIFFLPRDPCNGCLVGTVCEVKCEGKISRERTIERKEALWDIVRLSCSAVCLIFLLPFIYIKLLYEEKIGVARKNRLLAEGQ